MPGGHPLAAQLEVNRKTVEAALRQLEREGLLVGMGPGRNRRIVRPSGKASPRQLKVAILDYEPVEEAEALRAYARSIQRSEPGFAADLFAAANRHEVIEGG